MTSNVEAVMKYRSKNRERYNAYMREYNKTPKGIRNSLKSNLKLYYGLAIEDYEAMSEAQNHVCCLCGKPNKTKTCKRLVVEHNHTTGKIRGLVCIHCNNTIRRVESDIGIEKFMNYIGDVHEN